MDQIRQVAAGAGQNGFMAKSIQLACCGYQITQENAVLVFYALAGRNDDIVAVFFQLGYFFQEHILVKGALRQQNDVRAVAVSPGSQAGGTGSQPVWRPMISATVTLRMLYTLESQMTSFRMVAMYLAALP